MGAPLFAGGVEAIGVNGTGTFTQNCGTNAIVGGGQYAGNTGGVAGGSYYNNAYGTLLLGWYGGTQKIHSNMATASEPTTSTAGS